MTDVKAIKILRTKKIEGESKEDGYEVVEIFSSTEGLPFGVIMRGHAEDGEIHGTVGLVRCISRVQAEEVFKSWTVNAI